MRRTVQGDQIDERFRSNHDPGCVHSAVASKPFKARGSLYQQSHILIALHELEQLWGVLERLFNCDVEFVRYQLGNPVDVSEGHPHHSTHITHRRFCLEDVERSDLGHRIFAIKIPYVVNHLVSPALAKINVDIGHRYSVRIEESFEKQIEFHWIDISDSEGVGNKGTSG